MVNKILGFIFRRKTLNGILYLLIAFILGELAALEVTEEIIEFCEKVKSQNPDNWKFYGALIIEIVFGKGSMFSIKITLGLIVLVSILKIVESITSKSPVNQNVENLKSVIKAQTFTTRLGTQNGFEGLKNVRRELPFPEMVSGLSQGSFQESINVILSNHSSLNEIFSELIDDVGNIRFKDRLVKQYKSMREDILSILIYAIKMHLDRYFKNLEGKDGNIYAIGWEDETLMEIWVKSLRLNKHFNKNKWWTKTKIFFRNLLGKIKMQLKAK